VQINQATSRLMTSTLEYCELETCGQNMLLRWRKTGWCHRTHDPVTLSEQSAPFILSTTTYSGICSAAANNTCDNNTHTYVNQYIFMNKYAENLIRIHLVTDNCQGTFKKIAYDFNKLYQILWGLISDISCRICE